MKLFKMPKVVVNFIVLEEGEFLYDEETLNIYDCLPPHNYVGKIDLNLFKIIKSDTDNDKYITGLSPI